MQQGMLVGMDGGMAWVRVRLRLRLRVGLGYGGWRWRVAMEGGYGGRLWREAMERRHSVSGSERQLQLRAVTCPFGSSRAGWAGQGSCCLKRDRGRGQSARARRGRWRRAYRRSRDTPLEGSSSRAPRTPRECQPATPAESERRLERARAECKEGFEGVRGRTAGVDESTRHSIEPPIKPSNHRTRRSARTCTYG